MLPYSSLKMFDVARLLYLYNAITTYYLARVILFTVTGMYGYSRRQTGQMVVAYREVG
jgi:hypothetical protein